jgi:hypothetical protein
MPVQMATYHLTKVPWEGTLVRWSEPDSGSRWPASTAGIRLPARIRVPGGRAESLLSGRAHDRSYLSDQASESAATQWHWHLKARGPRASGQRC